MTSRDVVERTDLNVLIVDYEVDYLTNVAKVLEERGYNVFKAKDGFTVTSILQSWTIDVAFVDIQMPVIDGVEVLKEIKYTNPEVHVVMMTAYPTMETTVSTLMAGALDYLHKPVKVERMIEILEELREAREVGV